MAEESSEKESVRYELNGSSVPSVTEITGCLFSRWDIEEKGGRGGNYYLRRGRAMHYGALLLDQGILDWSSVAPAIEPRLKAYQAFRQKFPWHIELSERPLVSVEHRFGGTPDRVFRDDAGLILCDLKSSLSPVYAPQMGGYAVLLSEHGYEVNRCLLLELTSSGGCRTEWMVGSELEDAKRLFLSCLEVYRYGRRHKMPWAMGSKR